MSIFLGIVYNLRTPSDAFAHTLVVKTTNLATRSSMNTGVTRHHLLIYKSKIFIGSYGCRNDCLAVHFICHKRRDLGAPPPEPGRHKIIACRVWLACKLRECTVKTKSIVLAISSLSLYSCVNIMLQCLAVS